MSDSITIRQRCGIGLRAVLWFLLALLAFMGFAVIGQASLWIVAALLLLGILLAVPIWWVRRFFAKEKTAFTARRPFLWTSLATCLAMIALAGLPIYYFATKVESSPPTVPQVRLSNGERTIVLQGMMHVGSETFYKSVVYDLEEALAEGYTLFYEGVQPSPGEGDQWFAEKVTGKGDLSGSYKQLAGLCGLQFQLDYFNFLNEDAKKHPERHVTADVNTLDMKREWDRLVTSDPIFAAWAMSTEGEAGAGEQISESPMFTAAAALENAGPGAKHIAGIIGRGLVAIGAGGASQEPINPRSKDPVIIEFRNRVLAKRLIESSDKKIYVTYGARHFPGVIAILQQQNPAWKVESVKWSRTLSTPEHLTGTL
jgi:hypothetical protein